MEEKKNRATTTINPSPEAWKRFKMAALDRDISLSDAIDQAIEQWCDPPKVRLVTGVEIPEAFLAASKEQLDFAVLMLKAYSNAERRARQDPDPAGGPIVLPQAKKRR